MATGSITLKQHPGDVVVVVCDRDGCGRRGQYRKSGLIAKHGPNAALPDVLREIAGCERNKPYGNDLCGARFEGL